MPEKVDRPVKVTLALTVEHAARFQLLGQAMGQQLGTVATISATMGLNTLEHLYGLKDMRAAIEAAAAPAVEEAVRDMIGVGLQVPGEPGK